LAQKNWDLFSGVTQDENQNNSSYFSRFCAKLWDLHITSYPDMTLGWVSQTTFYYLLISAGLITLCLFLYAIYLRAESVKSKDQSELNGYLLVLRQYLGYLVGGFLLALLYYFFITFFLSGCYTLDYTDFYKSIRNMVVTSSPSSTSDPRFVFVQTIKAAVRGFTHPLRGLFVVFVLIMVIVGCGFRGRLDIPGLFFLVLGIGVVGIFGAYFHLTDWWYSGLVFSVFVGIVLGIVGYTSIVAYKDHSIMTTRGYVISENSKEHLKAFGLRLIVSDASILLTTAWVYYMGGDTVAGLQSLPSVYKSLALALYLFASFYKYSETRIENLISFYKACPH